MESSAVVPGTKISTHGGNDKAWVWSALDFADGEQKIEMLAIRFGTAESALLLFCRATDLHRLKYCHSSA